MYLPSFTSIFNTCSEYFSLQFNHFLGTLRTRIGFLPQKTGICQGKRHGQMMSKEADLAHSRKLRQESEGQQLRRKKAAFFLGGHGHCPMVKMGGEIASDIFDISDISDISALYSVNDDGIYIYTYIYIYIYIYICIDCDGIPEIWWPSDGLTRYLMGYLMVFYR